MNVEERRAKLLQLVQARGFASLPELVTEVAVSESTVRRDLDALEESGSVKRTHGGAFYAGPSPNLPHFRQRQEAQWDKKKQIAIAAARLIEDGDTVLLDGGSTTYELARVLLGRPLQVVTNSLPVANLFNTGANTDLIIIGGYVHARTGSVQGPYASEMLKKLHVRRAVISAAGINDQGIFNTNRLLVETQWAMMATTDEVIVVADSTKFGHQSLAHAGELHSINKMVVDSQLSESWREKIVAAGVDLILAEDAENNGAGEI
jgi:DeoR/GlpR family transcriptional regulator of sugar metabolism